MTLARSNSSRRQAWTRWAQPRLLDLQLCDLGLKIEGTWIATVTPPFGAPSFTGYSSYVNGGVFIVAPDRLPPALGTTIGNAQGAWRPISHGRFVSTHVELRYGPAGDVVGSAKVRAVVRLTSDDTFEGQGQLQLCDATLENCLPPGPALSTITGKRLRAELPILP